MKCFGPNSESGLTLIEMILTMTILISLSIGSVMVIRNSLNLRDSLSSRNKLSHKLNTIMQKISYDLEHAYILSTKDAKTRPLKRSTKTIFERNNDGSIRFTTTSHRASKANAPESDQTLVAYELRKDKENSGRMDLYRGETKVIPKRLKDDVPMQLLAKGVHKFEVIPWDGTKFDDGRWSSDRSDHRNQLPRLVKVHIEVLEIDDDIGDERAVEEIATSALTSVIYLQKSWGLDEHKEYSGGIKWY